jgi:hypothetical protein
VSRPISTRAFPRSTPCTILRATVSGRMPRARSSASRSRLASSMA